MISYNYSIIVLLLTNISVILLKSYFYQNQKYE